MGFFLYYYYSKGLLIWITLWLDLQRVDEPARDVIS